MSGKRGGAGEGTYRSFLLGYVLALVLTSVSFFLVMTSAMPATLLAVAIVVSAGAQVGVHLVFFLHLNRSSAQRWNAVVLAYTIIILAILVGASVWILHHLGRNMMGT